nr:hypothetical protein [Candidatus Freyarchaeota archaeon]
MNSKGLKILLIGMLIVSILYFWYCYNTANTINTLQTLKSFTKADPLWWAKSTINSIVDTILDNLKKIFGIV